ncbi:DHH family phosphoesterase [Clostridium chrysemydis]|uniref:DHH family phosphoesterase n=1 Tax=Clostridium chrysemydis TaxID=2665504 RepID=UPI0018848ED7|nr:bifunctional oligoribonuclease/PAP phosphatase NrnA [Clostridium chrysemydis]
MLKEIANFILNSNKIGLTFHTSPDGDAIGSTLGLLNALRELGKDAYIISKDTIPDNMGFLSLASSITGEVTKPTEDTDLVVVLDCGNVERISAELASYKGKLINVDHHISNEYYGDLNYVDINASATAEIVYLLLKELGYEMKSNTNSIEIGTCLYTSLITDTGSFRHSNVTQRTLQIASDLIGIGVNNTNIYISLFDNRSLKKLKLIGHAFSEADLVFNNKLAVATLSLKTLKELDCEKEDTSDIIGNLLSLKGVEIAILLKENDEGVKASLRSKYDVDVRMIAEKFGGGGHVKAAGVMQKGVSMVDAKNNLINEIGKEI